MAESSPQGSFVFSKMSGAGNDFIVAEARRVGDADPAELAKRLCRRRLSIGADGLLLVSPIDRESLHVDYWNADGTPAAFCGNGARCAARFAVLTDLAPAALRLRFGNTWHPARVHPQSVEVEVGSPRTLGRPLELLHDGQPMFATHVLAQVEHLVFAVDEFAELSVTQVAAAALKQHPHLLGRVNVSLSRREGASTIHLRTFERGSGETLACGSAALAVAHAFFGDAGPCVVEVIPTSGLPLAVGVPADATSPYTLTGEARLIYQGVVDL